MRPEDWTLLVMNAAEGAPLSPVQLQKTLFLIRQNLQATVGEGFYEFEPYSYGPFCAEVYRDAERMEAHNNLVHIERGTYKEYSATPAGRQRASELERELPQDVVDYIHRVVTWARSISFNQLVQAIYKQYPQYRVNSVFQG